MLKRWQFNGEAIGGDTKAVNLEKGLSELFKEYEDVWDDRDKMIAEGGYNQALQFNAGRFSLVDMRNILNIGMALRQDQLSGHSVGSGEEALKRYIESLLPKKQEDINLYCELEYDKVFGDGSRTSISEERIKLINGQPIIHFK